MLHRAAEPLRGFRPTGLIRLLKLAKHEGRLHAAEDVILVDFSTRIIQCRTGEHM